jgi:hypothetical protein
MGTAAGRCKKRFAEHLGTKDACCPSLKLAQIRSPSQSAAEDLLSESADLSDSEGAGEALVIGRGPRNHGPSGEAAQDHTDTRIEPRREMPRGVNAGTLHLVTVQPRPPQVHSGLGCDSRGPTLPSDPPLCSLWQTECARLPSRAGALQDASESSGTAV